MKQPSVPRVPPCKTNLNVNMLPQKDTTGAKSPFTFQSNLCFVSPQNLPQRSLDAVVPSPHTHTHTHTVPTPFLYIYTLWRVLPCPQPSLLSVCVCFNKDVQITQSEFWNVFLLSHQVFCVWMGLVNAIRCSNSRIWEGAIWPWQQWDSNKI